MNRVELAALNGSVIAKRTLELSKFKQKVSMVSSVRGSGNRPPTAKETMQARESKSHD